MKMKKIIIPLIISILLIIIIWIAGFMVGIFSVPEPLMNFFGSDGEKGKAVELINKSYPTDVIIYGKKIEFEENIERRYVDELSEKTLARNKKYDYTAIVINDLDNNVTLDDKTIEYIGELLEKETYLVLYFGSKFPEKWSAAKEGQAEVSIKGNLGYNRYNFMGKKTGAIGIWMKDDNTILEENPYFLSSRVVHEILFYLEDVN